MSACAVVGGQFGSEGRGLIVGRIARGYDKHVRVGAANAGHTLYTDTAIDPLNRDGLLRGWEKHVMQQIPCAAYANPEADLFIGPGALISPTIFRRELDALQGWRCAHGLPPILIRVDERAHVIQDSHIAWEAGTDLAERIGSTSTIAREGIGAAQAARAFRDRTCVLARDFYDEDAWWDEVMTIDVPRSLARGKVLLEGTQGYSLSNTTGAFPFVTSRNTTIAGLCADAGFPATQVSRRILVCRTYPIRVAGNSGPFHQGSTEIQWADIGIDRESERTTVTKKVRRVATFSMDQVVEACILNDPTEIALTFCDYIDPSIGGKVAGAKGLGLDHPDVARLVWSIEEATEVPVTMLGTGPHSVLTRRSS